MARGRKLGPRLLPLRDPTRVSPRAGVCGAEDKIKAGVQLLKVGGVLVARKGAQLRRVYGSSASITDDFDLVRPNVNRADLVQLLLRTMEQGPPGPQLASGAVPLGVVKLAVKRRLVRDGVGKQLRRGQLAIAERTWADEQAGDGPHQPETRHKP